MLSKSEERRYKLIRRKLRKLKIGLPEKVTFKYKQGIVECYPKERKWIVTPKGKKSIIHIRARDIRNDVTKYKAKHLLKMGIINALRDDSAVTPML